jgi:glycerophosphoryl diester phosphodiesterase
MRIGWIKATGLVGLQMLEYVMNYRILNKVVYLLLIFLSACAPKQNITDSTYFNSKTIILGHRGMGVEYYKQTNTIESVLPLIGIGADGSEIDVQVTKDSVLVMYHNILLEDHTNCFGKICNYTWEEIKSCKYNLSLQTTIGTVDELFRILPNRKQFYFSFDCKIDSDTNNNENYVSSFFYAVTELCKKYDMTENVFLEGNLELLKKAKELNVKNKLFLNSKLTPESVQDAKANNFFGLSVDKEYLENGVEYAHSNGLRVMSFSPTSFTQNKYLLSKHVDIIQTDDPISILKYLERYNYEYIIP